MKEPGYRIQDAGDRRQNVRNRIQIHDAGDRFCDTK